MERASKSLTQLLPGAHTLLFVRPLFSSDFSRVCLTRAPVCTCACALLRACECIPAAAGPMGPSIRATVRSQSVSFDFVHSAVPALFHFRSVLFFSAAQASPGLQCIISDPGAGHPPQRSARFWPRPFILSAKIIFFRFAKHFR